MKRRDFTKVVGAAVAGLAAGSRLKAADEKEGESGAKHACKGMNECKGQGGCKSGDNGCVGKNSCKGKGGCAVTGKHEEKKEEKK